ncbi:MAG TPA: hypothetical protein DIW47_03330 [Bacteroidetes bacterium]|nr:hypothetical protein [Bacteroidota bacterium]
MPYTVFSFVFCLGLFLLSNQTKAQQSPAVEEINAISERNFSSYYQWNKPKTESRGLDTIQFTLSISVRGGGFNLAPPNILLLNRVICMNQLRQGNLYVLVFYYTTDSSKVESKRPFIFDHSDSVSKLLEAFNKLYRERGYPIPPTSCAEYENDLQAQKLTIRYIGRSKADNRVFVYGMDSAIEGSAIHRFLNGNLRLERNVTNGLLTGIQRDYYESGALFFEGKYVNGVPDGDHILYFESGVISMKATYVNGLEHGETITYWENGQMNTRTKVIEGVYQSEDAWYDDGTPQE